MKRVSIVIIIAALAGCTNQENASKVLSGAGYSDIQFTGYSFFQCSKDDFYSTGFTAKGPTGQRVSGAVCAGMFLKGSTIRMD